MNIKYHIIPKKELQSTLKAVVSSLFKLDIKLLPSQFAKKLDFLLSNFKSSCWFLVEYPYVDRIYRDSYYLYYSSKYGRYSRDCVRVSIFSERIRDTDFRSQDHINTLKNNYLGFLFFDLPSQPL